MKVSFQFSRYYEGHDAKSHSACLNATLELILCGKHIYEFPFSQLMTSSHPVASIWFEIWGAWIQVKNILIFPGKILKISIF